MDKFYGGGGVEGHANGATSGHTTRAANACSSDWESSPAGKGRGFDSHHAASRYQALPASTYAAMYAREAMADHPSAEDMREAFNWKYGEL